MQLPVEQLTSLSRQRRYFNTCAIRMKKTSLIVRTLAGIQNLAWTEGLNLKELAVPRYPKVRRLREAEMSPHALERHGDRIQCTRCAKVGVFGKASSRFTSLISSTCVYIGYYTLS